MLTSFPWTVSAVYRAVFSQPILVKYWLNCNEGSRNTQALCLRHNNVERWMQMVWKCYNYFFCFSCPQLTYIHTEIVMGIRECYQLRSECVSMLQTKCSQHLKPSLQQQNQAGLWQTVNHVHFALWLARCAGLKKKSGPELKLSFFTLHTQPLLSCFEHHKYTRRACLKVWAIICICFANSLRPDQSKDHSHEVTKCLETLMPSDYLMTHCTAWFVWSRLRPYLMCFWTRSCTWSVWNFKHALTSLPKCVGNFTCRSHVSRSPSVTNVEKLTTATIQYWT